MLRSIVIFVAVSLVFSAVMVPTLESQSTKTFATTITVPDDYPTIQEAINNANDGDTIFVRAGTYYENVVVNKTLSLVGENRETTIVDGQRTGPIVQLGASHTNLTGFTVQNSGPGNCIELSSPEMKAGYLNISNNLIRSGSMAILDSNGAGGGNNIILNNTISDFATAGLNLYNSGSMIIGNSITDCEVGILIWGASENLVSDNCIARSSNIGIWLSGDANFTITHNTIQGSGSASRIIAALSNSTVVNNTIIGMSFFGSHNMIAGNYFLSALSLEDYSDNNTVQNNTFMSSNIGLSLSNSWYNVFFSNSFLADGEQVDSVGSENTWDNGYPSGGNYWKDYVGADFYNGPYQNETGSDGIGDTPYIIDVNNRDNYPLYYADTVPPNITSIANNPLVPNYDQSVDVSCVIVDNVGVSQAILSYQTSSGWINASMNGFGVIFNATMPSRPYGTTVQYEVYANDTSGNWAESDIYSCKVGDFVSPQIQNLEWKPTCPYPYVSSNVTRPNEPTQITANVNEPVNASGVAKVLFSYRVDAGEWWNTTMTYDSTAQLWTRTIPGQSNSTSTVEFLIQACDNAGNLNTSSVQSCQISHLRLGDVNGDGKIDITDVATVAKHFGEHYP